MNTHYFLAYLLELLRAGKFQVALHHRTPDAWTRKKQLSWVHNLRRDLDQRGWHTPLGALSIYTLAGDESGLSFLNDGLQRLTAIQHAQADPNGFGFSDRQSIDALCTSMNVLVQTRVYQSHREAVPDYIAVNTPRHRRLMQGVYL